MGQKTYRQFASRDMIVAMFYLRLIPVLRNQSLSKREHMISRAVK
jgi:hypothetical protein